MKPQLDSADRGHTNKLGECASVCVRVSICKKSKLKNKWKTTELSMLHGVPCVLFVYAAYTGQRERERESARVCVLKLKWLPSSVCVGVCVIRYFSDLCHNACKSIKCDEQEEEASGRRRRQQAAHSNRAKNLAQCVRLFVMGSQTHFNFICDALRTNTQTARQADRQRMRGAGEGERWQSVSITN